jgi:MFS family permease
MVISTILIFMQGLIAVFFDHPSSIMVISATIGIVYSAMYICHANIIFELAPPEETSLFIGLSNSLIAPIIGTAPILAGAIIEGLGYTQLFIAISISAILAFFVSVFGFKEPREIEIRTA